MRAIRHQNCKEQSPYVLYEHSMKNVDLFTDAVSEPYGVAALPKTKFQTLKAGVSEEIDMFLALVFGVVCDRNHYFGLGPIPKPKPTLGNTFGQYHNLYRNHISKGKSYGVFFPS